MLHAARTGVETESQISSSRPALLGNTSSQADGGPDGAGGPVADARDWLWHGFLCAAAHVAFASSRSFCWLCFFSRLLPLGSFEA